MTARLGRAAFPLFVLLTLGVYAAACFVVGRLGTVPSPQLLAGAVAVDLVVLVPALYYALLVRGRQRPAITLAPVVVLSMVGAYAVLPEAYEGVLGPFEIGVVLVEAAALTWIGLRIRAVVRAYRASGDADLLERLRGAFGAAFGHGFAMEAAAAEASVPLYAFGRGVERRDATTFGYRQRSGYASVFAGLLIGAAVELALGHFLLLHYWNATAAGVHLALSVYGALWLVADLRAMHARPIRLGARGLVVRCGLRWTASVPLAQIAEVRRLERGSYAGTDGFLDLTPLGAARYAIVLREPVRVRGPLGITRVALRLGVDVDDRERFERALADAIGAA
ncbi:hypothetical protein [Rubricoccus marinus]|uniref:Uncharacterized protein n=1 Tax=Rubricoccus marinus TaxID=716817 RepID=A0A259U1L7_9BACT|nr:hypothetical protein [Rubricoccus marinus]OZC03840.1 hypothetical protein BSZ36_13100 [Rubricoccus marinus]